MTPLLKSRRRFVAHCASGLAFPFMDSAHAQALPRGGWVHKTADVRGYGGTGGSKKVVG